MAKETCVYGKRDLWGLAYLGLELLHCRPRLLRSWPQPAVARRENPGGSRVRVAVQREGGAITIGQRERRGGLSGHREGRGRMCVCVCVCVILGRHTNSVSMPSSAGG
jgi:hypothetical protein